MLYGTEEACLAAFLRRERESGRNLPKVHWLRNNSDIHTRLGDGGFIPFRRRNSNGIATFAKRFVQYGLIWPYSIFFVPSTICASHSRSTVVVIRSQFSFFTAVRLSKRKGA